MECKKCKHYNEGQGDIYCDFCDPPFEDRYEEIEEIKEDK